MIDFDSDDGADVLVVTSGEAEAVWIDGEKVYDHDDLRRTRLMDLLAQHTDGRIASYDEKEAVINKSTEEWLDHSVPDSLDDIVFSEDITTIRIYDTDDLYKIQNFNQDDGEYLIVKNLTQDITDDFIRDYTPERIEVFDIQ